MVKAINLESYEEDLMITTGKYKGYKIFCEAISSEEDTLTDVEGWQVTIADKDEKAVLVEENHFFSSARMAFLWAIGRIERIAC